ncbi:MAG TPA: hypothetical protein VFL36_19695 [Myxococcales bacterium]|nr:hypothetical protein [Myxococcales bacterium]
MNQRRGALSSVLRGAIAALLLAAPPALAQTTVSTFTIQVSGTASSVKTGLPETVKFSGPVVITTTVVTDPSSPTPTATTTLLPPSVEVSIDGRGVTGVGQKTGTIYNNECEARLTRLFSATDTISLTFAFYPAPPPTAAADAVGAYMSSKTGLLTLNLTYDTATTALTGVTASLGTL